MSRKHKGQTPIVKAVGVESKEIKSGEVKMPKARYKVCFLKDWFGAYGMIRAGQTAEITASEFENLSKINYVKEV